MQKYTGYLAGHPFHLEEQQNPIPLALTCTVIFPRLYTSSLLLSVDINAGNNWYALRFYSLSEQVGHVKAKCRESQENPLLLLLIPRIPSRSKQSPYQAENGALLSRSRKHYAPGKHWRIGISSFYGAVMRVTDAGGNMASITSKPVQEHYKVLHKVRPSVKFKYFKKLTFCFYNVQSFWKVSDHIRTVVVIYNAFIKADRSLK